MFGIGLPDKSWVICHYRIRNEYVMSPLNGHNSQCPVMITSSMEADLLLQKFLILFNNYDLMVIKFTKEEEEELTIRKLKGY